MQKKKSNTYLVFEFEQYEGWHYIEFKKLSEAKQYAKLTHKDERDVLLVKKLEII